MTITALYAGLIGLILIVLSGWVIQFRISQRVSLGDGGHKEMQRRIRAQANLVEYAPMALILIGLLDYAQTSPAVLHALGAGLVAGRILHGWALGFTRGNPFGRTVGATLTLLVIIAAAVMNVANGIAALGG